MSLNESPSSFATSPIEDVVRDEWHFVFFGCGTEYVLQPWHRHMRDQGWSCCEIDGFTDDVPARLREAVAVGRRVALVSSQHFYYGTPLGPGYHPNRVASMLEAAAALRPDFICYTPHDLTEPVHPDEWPYLRAIDLYLAVDERELALQRYCEVQQIGWIKRLAEADSLPAMNAAWLVSSASSIANAIGTERCCDLIAEHAGRHIAVKLSYLGHVTELEQGLRERGVQVIDSRTNSNAVMRAAQVIITNGVSSVAREAAHYGRRVVMLLDPRLQQWHDQATMWKLVDVPNVTFVDSLEGLDLLPPLAEVPDDGPGFVPLERVTQYLVESIARRKVAAHGVVR